MTGSEWGLMYISLRVPISIIQWSRGVILARDFSAKKHTSPNPNGILLRSDKIRSANLYGYNKSLSYLRKIKSFYYSGTLSLLATAICLIWCWDPWCAGHTISNKKGIFYHYTSVWENNNKYLCGLIQVILNLLWPYFY